MIANIQSFDLARLTKAKQAVDLAPNTIRNYARNGLPLYRMGRAVFFSRSELEQFIRAAATAPEHAKAGGGR
jgi:hypothetical protein